MATKTDYKFSDFFQFQPQQMVALNHVFPPDGDWTKQKKFIFYGGAKAGGKTAWAIGTAALVALRFPGIKIAVARKTVRELQQQIILEFQRIFPENVLYKYFKSSETIVFHNGSRINFISFQHPEDVLKEQGIERQLYILDEAPQMEESIFSQLMSTVRNPRIKNWKPSIFFTGNPGGVSDLWFINYFINPRHDLWPKALVKQKDEFVFVPATVWNNQVLLDNQPDYADTLDGLPPHLRDAYFLGKWGGFTGQFFEEWEEAQHMLAHEEVFDVNDDAHVHWPKWRSIDLGRGQHPSVCLWLTQDPHDGTLYVYRELGHKGTILPFVEGVKMMSPPTEQYITTFADPAMFAKDNDAYDMTQYFTDIYLEPANNERTIGWNNMKQWMHWIPSTGGSAARKPRLRFFPECSGIKDTLPYLKYKSNGAINDLNTKQQDDYADAIRYATSHLQYGYIYEQRGRYRQFNDRIPIPDYGELRNPRERSINQRITPMYASFDGEVNFEHEDGYSTSIYSYY